MQVEIVLHGIMATEHLCKKLFESQDKEIMLLTPEEVRHVAMLARLGLTEEEVESLRVQLSDVLDHIAMLDKLDTSHIEPTAQVTAQVTAQRNVSRPDEVTPSLLPADVLLNAPHAEEGFIRVPAVMEEVKVSSPSNVDSAN